MPSGEKTTNDQSRVVDTQYAAPLATASKD